jgi:hypothetical protein
MTRGFTPWFAIAVTGAFAYLAADSLPFVAAGVVVLRAAQRGPATSERSLRPAHNPVSS